ncbi:MULTISPECIES: hypothetical protein [unclassified Nocardioides]|jgi:hypothetical protein|uniref:hypothetical protein n=1 Tax=unclassified Nocardioides TaxID=2615069 RepID=UPI001170BE94|nr:MULTISPECIES: hypothetical protein [unclassified Nocardioides]TQK69152.1 hypothetical protein FBY23_0912 [Nocardioides sp. SLBN-35]WGY01541.1 hypothetical protein QI633_23775 [Nocardioides sp. QY071]
MTKTTSPETQIAGRHLEPVEDLDAVDRSLARRAALRDRHAHGLSRLMDERTDLRGVHPLADFVDDAIRWSA